MLENKKNGEDRINHLFFTTFWIIVERKEMGKSLSLFPDRKKRDEMESDLLWSFKKL